MTTKTDGGSLGRGAHVWVQHRKFPTPRTMLLEEPENCTFVIRHMNYDTKQFFTGAGSMTLSLCQRRPDGSRLLRIWRNVRSGRTFDVTRFAASPSSDRSRSAPAEQRALWDGIVRLYARTGTAIPADVRWVGDYDAAAGLTLLAYPALTARVQRRKRNKLPTFHALPDSVRPAARTDTAHAFARTLFGARMLRRDIVREAVTAPFDVLDIATRVKHLVPVDWIAEFLTTAKAYEDKTGNAVPLFYPTDAARFATFLEHVPCTAGGSCCSPSRPWDASPRTRVCSPMTSPASTWICQTAAPGSSSTTPSFSPVDPSTGSRTGRSPRTPSAPRSTGSRRQGCVWRPQPAAMSSTTGATRCTTASAPTPPKRSSATWCCSGTSPWGGTAVCGNASASIIASFPGPRSAPSVILCGDTSTRCRRLPSMTALAASPPRESTGDGVPVRETGAVTVNPTVIMRCDHPGCTATLVPAYDGEDLDGVRLIARAQFWLPANTPEGRRRGFVDLCPAHSSPIALWRDHQQGP